MKSLIETIKDAEAKKIAIGHFNISDLVSLKAIFEAAHKLGLPVIIGVSEGERDFIGIGQAVALIKSLREEYSTKDGEYPIYLNADHTHSFQGIKEAVQAGFDSAVFDFSKSPLEENIAKTKEAAEWTRETNPDFVIEGEMGYIGGGSVIMDKIPDDIAIKEEDLTKPEDAARFVKETRVDMLAPAVGNIHGMFKNAPNPDLNIKRIKDIKDALQAASGQAVPLVLHGGSGIKDSDFILAIKSGMSIVHINTELRVAWRKGVEEALKNSPDEIVPYKLLPKVKEEIEKIIEARLRLFSGI
ncbi:MAG: class II fructose-bisphosphate aldolase [Candidatus Wolfebacteria bacterium]|nr:class II fructose-bisphosphate aldolase [Candidatus Wolfebacteria bacterium]